MGGGSSPNVTDAVIGGIIGAVLGNAGDMRTGDRVRIENGVISRY